jgi:hypothetical protein
MSGKLDGKTAERCQRVVDSDIWGIDLTICNVVNGDHPRLSLAFTARDLEDEKKFRAIDPERVSAGPVSPPFRGL